MRAGYKNKILMLTVFFHQMQVVNIALIETDKLHIVRTFSFKGSNMFSSFVCRFSRTLCSLSVPGKQERAELNAVLRTEITGKSTCLDSLQ